MEEPRWTLDELAERVGAALAVGYAGQPSGRVRDLPDRRAIRWYTTIGLIDRPVDHRGRTALYGPRHLLQLVAVKRLQARGLPLVAIQQELAGATDPHLARVARLPTSTPAPQVPAGNTPPAGIPSPLPTPNRPAIPSRPAAARAGGRAAGRAGAGQAAFWRTPPAVALAGARVGAEPGEAVPDPSPDPSPAPDPRDPGPDTAVGTLRGVRLGSGATLLLEPGRELDAEDLKAILEAAGPLLAALADRGLDRAEARREHP